MDHSDKTEARLVDCCRRIREGDPAAFSELGTFIKERAAFFLMGAGVGLHSEEAANIASRWIVDISLAARDATPPVQRWIEQQLEHIVHRDYFADGEALQKRIYCEMPLMPAGLNVTVRLRPAQRLTGDLVFVRRSEDWLLFVVGDITGHGTAAAAFGAFLYTWLDRFAAGNLSEMAVSLNREILSVKHGTTSMAATFARWNPKTGALEVLNCGTTAPAVVLRGGVATETPGGGWAVGMLPNAAFEVWRGEIAPGDALVLHTDGIVEQKSKDGEFGRDRLRQTAECLTGCDAAGIADAILAGVDAFAAGHPRGDDQLVLVAQLDSSI
jgi:serine phosphatase RsbU (regulator of sigma subunit)